jgi:hypothetical protein
LSWHSSQVSEAGPGASGTLLILSWERMEGAPLAISALAHESALTLCC